ncbi:glycosyltransferase [Acetobacter sp. AN02]|uniref:glycosyltransferase family 2 protein n=1 Tax=Acetobacter sp. AN02 TaxID=2894186 RepID=UPI0024342E9E|nr:glycosyltransferase [Acetobacter sp. AN02]MDG6094385.1 glycosyltransferase [Acetobacter sp. AN02]
MTGTDRGGLRVGIAITTWNRKETVLRQLELLREMTVCDAEIVVCDDGSSDGTAEAVRAAGYTVLGGVNRGIAWNKNRGLYYLFACRGVDMALLMDDDVVPRMFGWEQEWIEAGRRYGHANFVPDYFGPEIVIAGGCTAADIGVSTFLSGACMVVTREAFSLVGYMDPRFGRYGHEHTDYTLRLIRAGYGGFDWTDGDGRRSFVFFVLRGGVHLTDLPTSGTPEDIEANGRILEHVRDDPVARWPWVTEAMRAEFLEEFRAYDVRVVPEAERAGRQFDVAYYLAANPDIREAGVHPLGHYLRYGLAEGRKGRAD